jgi:hypothetical protein
MISYWWALVAFIVGGSAGILVMALMCMTGGLAEQSHVRGTLE